MQLEWNETVSNGKKVHIRPIIHEDVEREKSFVEHLSPESKRFRFMTSGAHPSNKELQRLCDVDYDHDMAFVALAGENGSDTIVGVSRYAAPDAEAKDVEIAITIADEWQHLGLGSLLLNHLIDYAKSRNIERLYSIDLADNVHMSQLAHDFGFTSKRDQEDARQMIHSLELAYE